MASGAGSLILKILPGSCILGIFGHALHGPNRVATITVPPAPIAATLKGAMPHVGLVVTDSESKPRAGFEPCAEKRSCRPATMATKGMRPDWPRWRIGQMSGHGEHDD